MSSTLYKFVQDREYENVYIIYVYKRRWFGLSGWTWFSSVGHSQVGRWLDDRCKEKKTGGMPSTVYEVEAGGWSRKVNLNS